jgi:hypothetical protein
MNGNLLVKKTGSQTLNAFVAEFSECLGCGPFEERQSSNYLGERYFRCFALGLEITVAAADNAEFGDYDFWVCFETEDGCLSDQEDFLAGLADCAARKFALCGHDAVRPLDYSRANSGAVLYRLNPLKGVDPRERVITEDI